MRVKGGRPLFLQRVFAPPLFSRLLGGYQHMARIWYRFIYFFSLSGWQVFAHGRCELDCKSKCVLIYKSPGDDKSPIHTSRLQ